MVEDQARGQTRSHPSDEDDFLWETRFLKPLVIVFIFYSPFVVLRHGDNQRDPWYPFALFFTWTFVILMRSVKQTAENCFSFHFKIFLPFLFFLISIKRGGLAFWSRKEMLEMFRFQDFFFGSCYTYIYIYTCRSKEHTFCLGRFTVERLISLNKRKGLALSRHLWAIHGFVCFRSCDGGSSLM